MGYLLDLFVRKPNRAIFCRSNHEKSNPDNSYRQRRLSGGIDFGDLLVNFEAPYRKRLVLLRQHLSINRVKLKGKNAKHSQECDRISIYGYRSIVVH